MEDFLPDQDIQQEKEKIRATLPVMRNAIEYKDIERYAGYDHPHFTRFGETDTIFSIGKETELKGIMPIRNMSEPY